jgi:bifunctional non-homologous end joining protein LigD
MERAEKLKEYRKKRDFSQTPEPTSSRRVVAGFRFVVHKHNARNLHYDLRLEHKGVLKSWAIPKGISFNPAEKHLAIMVEDHPFDYKDFEGVIPKGNYGAGEVIIWDEGTYVPLGTNVPLGYSGGDPDAGEKLMSTALAKGHVTVIFSGKKLKGEFALVKLKNRDNQWLIIKKADEYANAASDSDERSARSGRTLADVENE